MSPESTTKQFRNKSRLVSLVYVGLGSICLFGLHHDTIWVIMLFFLPVDIVSIGILMTVKEPILWVVFTQILMFMLTERIILYYITKRRNK
jgi:hypothetical protein